MPPQLSDFVYRDGGAEAGGLALGWGAGLSPGGGNGGGSFVFTLIEGEGKGVFAAAVVRILV